MVIQIRGTHGSGKSAILENLIEKRYGKEIRLGKKTIGWNLIDSVVLRSEGLTQNTICGYVRHFAKQRHVIFEDLSPSTIDNRYLALGREVRDYLIAFMDTPLAVCLANMRAQNNGTAIREEALREQWLDHYKLKERLQGAGYKVVSLRCDRSVQQVEVLLLSAPAVLGSHETLVLPRVNVRRSVGSLSRRTAKAA